MYYYILTIPIGTERLLEELQKQNADLRELLNTLSESKC
jgi:hypothetical protein